LGCIPKNWDLLLISATIEGSNFKFGTQLAFGTSLPKTTFWTKIGGGLGQGSIHKKLGPLPIFATVEASDLKIGTEHEFRFTFPNTSELREYHFSPHYDDDATAYSTCHQKLTGAQISLLSEIKQHI